MQQRLLTSGKWRSASPRWLRSHATPSMQPAAQPWAPPVWPAFLTNAPRLCRRCRVITRAQEARGEVTLLDYGAGNVRSVRNAIRKLGYALKEVLC